jgi:hypothetical protein
VHASDATASAEWRFYLSSNAAARRLNRAAERDSPQDGGGRSHR